jgi:hypothetical protein
MRLVRPLLVADSLVLARLLGEDHTPADGFTLAWHFSNEGLSAHLSTQALGSGGTTEKTLYIAH